MAGTLYLVATPIGNLEDITFRAVRILREADMIAAEDTRTSAPLLAHYDIKTPMTSYHEFNKLDKGETIIDKLKEGQDIALITDAGSPGISDPGEELVTRCYEEGIEVFAIPGPAAAITAVTTSGQRCRRFAFEAFLPKQKKDRKRILCELQNESRTIVIYEAPHHLLDTLKELRDALGGDRKITLCRELTKKFEEKLQFTLGEAAAYYEENEPRGEYVLCIAGKSRQQAEEERVAAWEDIPLEEHVQSYVNQGLDKKEAMRAAAWDRGIPKRDVYNELIKESTK